MEKRPDNSSKMNNSNFQDNFLDNTNMNNITSKLDKLNKSNVLFNNSHVSNNQFIYENHLNIKNISNKLNYNKYQDKTANNDFENSNSFKISEKNGKSFDNKNKNINNKEIENENLGDFLKNNIYQNENKEKKIKEKIEKTHFENEKIIINNLENELSLKNNEIRTLKKNFREKIELMENENKKIVNNLEDQFNVVIKNLNQNHVENVNGLEINTLKIKNEYDEILSKIHSNILNLKNNSVDAKKHENIIQDLKTKSFVKIEEYKNNYDEKIRELINFFDKPDYRKLIQNINFYMKFREKIDFTPEDLNFIENFNMTNQEYELWMDRIKLNLISSECDYINGVIELENNYLVLYEKMKSEENDKFKIIENEIKDKFERIDKISYFHEDEKTNISNIKEEKFEKEILQNFEIKLKQKIENLVVDNHLVDEKENKINKFENNRKVHFSYKEQNDNEQDNKDLYALDDINYVKKKFETAGLKKSYDINRHSKNQNNNNVNQVEYSSKFKTFKGNENESLSIEYQGKSIDDKVKEYLNSNIINNEKISNLNINIETNENINSNFDKRKIIEFNETNKNIDIYISNDLDV